MSGTGWRLRISHRTRLAYAGPVVSSYNEARMTPVGEPRQTVLDSRTTIRPAARTFAYEDYWGTLVTAFDVQSPHQTLEVVAESLVETSPPEPAVERLGWADLDTPAVTDRWAELLLTTPRTALDEELTARAAEIRRSSPTPGVAARAACDLVHEEIAYVPGSTGVQTDAVQVWRQREGVCQDISHLCVGLLRALGLPARYVSGYFYPGTDNAALNDTVTGQSHAWVEWYDGTWQAFDATNGVPVGERHVVIGRGRDYSDVPPLKGIYAGPATDEQTVAVTLTRLR